MVKKFFLLFLVTAGLVEGGFAGYAFSLKAKATKNLISPPAPIEERLVPERIEIEKLKIGTEVKPVGLNSEGQMEMPENPWVTAWYKDGASLGKRGSVVIAGHLDSPQGPAIFYHLFTLEEGDAVSVFDQKGKEYRFMVVKKETYDEDLFPLEEVFAANDKPRLNLITCRGKFNQATKRYDKRIVVYAEP